MNMKEHQTFYTLKKIFLLLISIFCVLNFYSQNLSQEEEDLYDYIMRYRISKGLPEIPISKSLTKVAQLHVHDLMNNQPDKGVCNLHSWSNKGDWSPCCYTSDHKKAECIWDKPREITGYKGDGYEISHWKSNGATASSAFNGWKNSPGHNRVMINLRNWSDNDWKAIGIGIYENYAVVWFGEEPDNLN